MNVVSDDVQDNSLTKQDLPASSGLKKAGETTDAERNTDYNSEVKKQLIEQFQSNPENDFIVLLITFSIRRY